METYLMNLKKKDVNWNIELSPFWNHTKKKYKFLTLSMIDSLP